MTIRLIAAAKNLLATLARPNSRNAIAEAKSEAMTAMQAGNVQIMSGTGQDPLGVALFGAVATMSALPCDRLFSFLDAVNQLSSAVATADDALGNEAIELCALADIQLVQCQEEEIAGSWDWRAGNDACDMSFPTKRDAAFDALKRIYGQDWRYQVGNEDTERGFYDWIRFEVLEPEAVEPELDTLPPCSAG